MCTLWTMPKRDVDYNFEKPTKTVRFDNDERERLALIMQSVRQRNQLVDPSKLIKELMGLTNNIGLTEEERAMVAGSFSGHRPVEVVRDEDRKSARKGRR